MIKKICDIGAILGRKYRSENCTSVAGASVPRNGIKDFISIDYIAQRQADGRQQRGESLLTNGVNERTTIQPGTKWHRGIFENSEPYN